jgi:hypothetical protein
MENYRQEEKEAVQYKAEVRSYLQRMGFFLRIL